ncbi:MAG: hypothetical protein AAGB48_05850 [Planctomycetota bacterium]
MRNARCVALLVLALVGFASAPCAATAQGAGVLPEGQPGSAAQRLGVRVLQRRQAVPSASVVVLVPDEAGLIDAVARWTPERIFPVLIDDGSPEAGERIGQFVRAFVPERVVRFETGSSLPEDAAQRQAVIDEALAASQGAGLDPTVTDGLQTAWSNAGHTPMGVVVADIEDPARAAALVLAAGHGQPIVWIPRAGNGRVGRSMNEQAARRLVDRIESGCERFGLPWRSEGDAIDAVTLCLNTPVKLRTSFGQTRNEQFALTDLVGRHGALDAGRLEPSDRWAWCGQVFGDAARAGHTAMASLFLVPDGAWLFDGYPSTQPWDQYDLTRTAELLERATITPTVYDEPGNGASAWLGATARAVGGGLVFVNSKGMATNFQLANGRMVARDVPMLAEPAAVSFVHSWSAQMPDDRATVAGRWFERGAIAYAGSVHEPFLQAFVPSPTVATRLLVGLPWSAAHRPDGPTPVWKITTLGDALWTLGRARPRLEDTGALPDEVSLSGALGSAMRARAFGDAVGLLVRLGRDEDAVELARAVLAEEPEAFDARFAASVAHAAFRLGRTDVLVASAQRLGPARSEALGVADALWMHAQPLLAGTVDAALAEALLANLRDSTAVRDALTLAAAEARARGPRAANRVLDAAERMVSEAKDIQRLRDARR